MRERCLQLTNTVAMSNMGDLYFEGFYSTKTKKDLGTGFDLNMADVTADKVIDLFPVIDSIVPLLKTFKGTMDCEMAATTQLDTAMNLIMPTINGIMKINGSDMQIDDNPAFRKIARLLLFRDRKLGKIDDVSMNGLIADNKMEIFPFVLKIDRYTLALSGLQDFGEDYHYHISVLRSPIPFRFGINVIGKGDFDNYKIRLGKAKYKNTNVPVFTQQIDTMRINLLNSIHNIFEKGVDKAIAENLASKNSFDAAKERINYTSEDKVEPLDSAEQAQIDSLLMAFDHPEGVGEKTDSLSDSTSSVQESTEEKIDNAISEIKQGSAESRKSRREARKAQRRAKKEMLKEDDNEE
jgi:hypothetical protein